MDESKHQERQRVARHRTLESGARIEEDLRGFQEGAKEIEGRMAALRGQEWPSPDARIALATP